MLPGKRHGRNSTRRAHGSSVETSRKAFVALKNQNHVPKMHVQDAFSNLHEMSFLYCAHLLGA